MVGGLDDGHGSYPMTNDDAQKITASFFTTVILNMR
jgi:hypothetical protein